MQEVRFHVSGVEWHEHSDIVCLCYVSFSYHLQGQLSQVCDAGLSVAVSCCTVDTSAPAAGCS
jgi:hypothetical protein